MSEITDEETRQAWIEEFKKSSRKQFTFNHIAPLYARPLISAGEELEDITSEFVLFKAFTQEKQAPVLIYDEKGQIKRGQLGYSLRALSKEEIEELKKKLPEKMLNEVNEIVKQYGPGTETKLFFKPVLPLKNLD